MTKSSSSLLFPPTYTCSCWTVTYWYLMIRRQLILEQVWIYRLALDGSCGESPIIMSSPFKVQGSRFTVVFFLIHESWRRLNHHLRIRTAVWTMDVNCINWCSFFLDQWPDAYVKTWFLRSFNWYRMNLQIYSEISMPGKKTTLRFRSVSFMNPQAKKTTWT